MNLSTSAFDLIIAYMGEQQKQKYIYNFPTKNTHTSMYKRINNNQDNRSINNSDKSSRGVPATESWKKNKKLQLDERSWMGSPMTDTVPPRSSVGTVEQNNPSMSYTQPSPQPYELLQSAFSQGTPKSNKSNNSNSKQPTQLIQQILKGLLTNKKATTVNAFYSQQSQQQLTQILTNKNKLQTYITQLQSEMPELSPQIVKNYQILILLLKHLSKSDIEVKHSSKGLELDFNRRQMIDQENQIDKLEKKIAEKDEHIKEIIQEYQSVIRNFNDVIEKLLEEKEGSGAKKEDQGRFTGGFNEKLFK